MTQVLINDAAMASQHVNIGVGYFNLNQFEPALQHFERALALNPDDPYARYNRATTLLSLGDYERGFVEYDATWRLFHWRGFGPVGDDIDRLNQLPLWRGETEVRLLLYHELGFGDAIMALRFLPEICRRAAVTLVIDPCLARLTARHFDVEVIANVPDDLTEFDVRLPLFAVMGALGVTEHTIPAAPYIPSAMWFGEGSKHNKLGIAWCGRTQTAFTLERFLSMLGHATIQANTLHALQPGLPSIDGVEPLPPGCDFLDLQRRIAAMDHIVSVDTAAIHLAGAMGHPSAHLLVPYLSDWRWHRTALWYPQLKTYRQDDASDWSRPFARLNGAIHDSDQR
jgi:tetratricopeptide (TPR) repeat protein